MGASSDLSNPGAEGVPFFTPAQNPPAGTALDASTAPTLFRPLRIRGVTLQNRFVVSPMCTYSARDGHATDFHLVHLGQFALSGAALTIVEATAVEARGRISPNCLGLWQDSQVAPLRRIVDFVHSQGGKAGIQLAHAGRKASTLASAIPFAGDYATPKALRLEDIKKLVQGFADAARRAVEAGFDVIEIHGAHGYLITQFLSSLTNKRTDDYGGSFENRTRFLREVVAAVRAVIPESMPLWLRISATEWMEYADKESWNIEDSIRLAKILPGLAIDVLDVSSGGNNNDQKIKVHTHYQSDLAGQIREAVRAEGLDLTIAAVGQVREADVAREIVQQNGDGRVGVELENGQVTRADLVLVARQFLRDPQFVLRVAEDLNVKVKGPNQYHRAAGKPRPRTKI
ncbi:unnamed protein product [Clonostachys rosea f. rosea IK726]|uniref:NADH:flavin oxidoreductase/NADH oxidase N-terminal domain-containing protein n=2 Tax=Bionectria ochroleuca TaxID=29856 RepID=A0A0B7JL56_BIOOC|nr:unnamed protein product [Clonostachys rosea f. rosea IK726]